MSSPLRDAAVLTGSPAVRHDVDVVTGPTKSEAQAGNADAEDSSPDVSVGTLERWNTPKVNIYRFVVANYSFIMLGMNDGALGVSHLST
jgi:hypothetical protein